MTALAIAAAAAPDAAPDKAPEEAPAREAPAPREYRTTWPWRSFSRAAAKPMPVGEAQLLRFALLPIAWRFAKGSRLRLSIAGADADHFVQTPHGRPPRLSVSSGGEQATMLELPTA